MNFGHIDEEKKNFLMICCLKKCPGLILTRGAVGLLKKGNQGDLLKAC